MAPAVEPAPAPEQEPWPCCAPQRGLDRERLVRERWPRAATGTERLLARPSALAWNLAATATEVNAIPWHADLFQARFPV